MGNQMNGAGSSAGDLGFEKQLFRAADALRNNMDAAEYKHVVLGLIFPQYISEAFEAKHAALAAEAAQGADPEDPDEYRAESIFWVPKEARWSFLLAHAKDAKIGTILDEAMTAIEKVNPSLKAVLPKEYARPGLDKQRLGQRIDMIGKIGMDDKANPTPWRLAKMNLAIRGIDANLGKEHADRYWLSQSTTDNCSKGGRLR